MLSSDVLLRARRAPVFLLALALATLPNSPAAQTGPPAAGAVTFTVFFRGVPVGSEDVSLASGPDGITISGTSRLGVPVDITARRVEVRYDAAWRPVAFACDAMIRGEAVTIRTTFSSGQAVNEVTRGFQTQSKTDPVAPDTIVLANIFFGAYEALAARLASASAGTELRGYVLPQMEIAVSIEGVTTEQFQTARRTIAARRFDLTFQNPGAPLNAQVSIDEQGRLLRLVVPAQSLEVVREDIASVSTRRQTITHPGDEAVRIPATGFSLAGTLTRPTAAPAATRLPAIVLVGGSGPTDRDETAAGIPIFAEIAGALAGRGFIVVRYDKRGVGQSGGRADAATLADYAEDVRSVLEFAAKRKDIDPKRIAVIGHSEGGWVSMLAARRDRRIAALALIATPGTTGAELILEQQRHALDRSSMPEAEKQAKVELQKKIQQAVVSGRSWEEIPPELRRQADTPWFRSVLTFDPAAIAPRLRPPVLILQGELDRQVMPAHAERLAALIRQRKQSAQTVTVVRIPGINHLLAAAETGEVSEYGSLPARSVSRELVDRLIEWLKTVTAATGGRAS